MREIKLPTFSNDRNLAAIDPLDSRYFDPEIARYLSEASRITCQAYIEAALAETLADVDVISRKISAEITTAALNVDPSVVYREEQVTKHDIKALVNCIKANVSDPAKPYVHFGATSYDIIASANALQMKMSVERLVIPRLKVLLTTLISLTKKYANTPQIGRTHGQHALPVTFGFALAEYVERLGASTQAVKELSNDLSGKFSGAVGAYNAIGLFVKDPIKFETAVLSKAGLKASDYSTQIVPPEEMIRLIDELTIVAGVMGNLGNDMRHLQRSEINEVSEKFEEGQVGSSTMAHKKNPVNFENVVSLSKQVTAQSINANLNISSDHQRDLTDSASSRFYPTVPALVAVMAGRLNQAMSRLEINEAAMQNNLKLSGGAIAAEPLYLLFEKYGHTEAHELAKKLAHRALAQKQSLIEIVELDEDASKYLKKFNSSERQIIQAPEKFYGGLSAQKAKSIVMKWQSFSKI